MVVVVVAVGGYFIFVEKPEPVTQESTPPSPVTNTPLTQTVSPISTPTLTQQPQTETPVVEKNVTGQPAYLIDAYLKNEKNYIDIDYVEWLRGEASIEAQVQMRDEE